ncbi:adenylyl-sulfate kinase [Flavimaricola marinus]|uniref:Adenylyl-sulfate kinase n=1 Tax=Flavimaricola marinus TaxID=1819565 RepID=A0A238LHR7_9RHOB|nr:adenylyl-sulfate kinase [Flavimaricola marinus]SMY09152.1 Adenylyl-sulfate kinase [Flavimaricola marinus]
MSAIWLTGLSGAGKSTLAKALCARLDQAGVGPLLLDGDEIRRRLPKTYGHDLPDRAEVLRHVVAMAKAAKAEALVPVVATISHQRWMRDLAREELAPMLEVWVDSPPEVCAARDPKGLYRRAKAGEFTCFIGVTHAYEPALPGSAGPGLRLRTDELTEAEALGRLVQAALRHLA